MYAGSRRFHITVINDDHPDYLRSNPLGLDHVVDESPHLRRFRLGFGLSGRVETAFHRRRRRRRRRFVRRLGGSEGGGTRCQA